MDNYRIKRTDELTRHDRAGILREMFRENRTAHFLGTDRARMRREMRALGHVHTNRIDKQTDWV